MFIGNVVFASSENHMLFFNCRFNDLINAGFGRPISVLIESLEEVMLVFKNRVVSGLNE